MAEPSPLQRYLSVQQQTDREMAKLLLEAAQEAEAMVAALADKPGLGAVAKRAQFQATAAQLRAASRQMWVALGGSIDSGMNAAGQAAHQAERARTRALFNALGGPIPQLEAALAEQARQTVNTYKARLANNISLSQQVYNTSLAANGALNTTINKGILLGKGWQDIAKDVRQFIDPNVPGGVSYAAKRLARTELNNAFHTTQIDQRKGDPFVTGMKWELSGSHPRPDACNDYADSAHYSGGDPGVFKVENVPRKPHPQCLCFLTSVDIGEEEFIAGMTSGRFNSYIDSKVYEFDAGVC
jgi:hypothetical protein